MRVVSPRPTKPDAKALLPNSTAPADPQIPTDLTRHYVSVPVSPSIYLQAAPSYDRPPPNSATEAQQYYWNLTMARVHPNTLNVMAAQGHLRGLPP